MLYVLIYLILKGALKAGYSEVKERSRSLFKVIAVEWAWDLDPRVWLSLLYNVPDFSGLFRPSFPDSTLLPGRESLEEK